MKFTVRLIQLTTVFVVKAGNDYVLRVFANGKPELWTRCQHCALHANEGWAHKIAHGDSRTYRVVRIKPKAKK